jgi:PBSX family phage portal protein
MALEFIRNEQVPVEGEEPAEVEVYVMKDSREAEPVTDPFLTVDPQVLPRKVKRRYDTITKAAPKQKDANVGRGSKALSPEVLTAYDLLQIVTPPYDLDMLAKLYEMNAAHNAAVTMKAVNIVGLGWDWVYTDRVRFELSKLQKKSQSSYETALNKFEEEKIALNEQLDLLNDDETFSEVMTKIWTDVESLGVGYLEIGRNNSGKINYLGHVPGQTVRVRGSRDGFIQMVSNKYVYFRNFGDEESKNPLGTDSTPNEMMQFKKYTPNSTYYGIPDIIPALPAALGDKFAREYNLDYFENKTVPRYAFILKGARLSAKAEQTLINYFKNELKGKHHGTLYIPIPAGFGQQVEAEFKEIEVGIQEGSFTEYLKENRAEILMVHRVPPGKVGIHEKTNLAVSRDADKTFKEQVCAPEQSRVEKKINKITKEFTENFKLKLDEADLIDADIQSRIYDRYLRTQVYTPNDVLQKLGEPTRGDGNEPLPYMKGPNEGGGPVGQKTSDGAKPTRGTPPDATGQRQERGQAQDAGRQPATRVSTG